MTADDSRRLVTFTGKVVARQGDLVISCDAMNVSYQPAGSYAPPAAREEGAGIPDAAQAPAADVQDGGRHLPEGASAPAAGRSPLSGGQEIDRVECEGAVKIQQGDRLAVARKALYLAKALPRRLILTGEARVWQGASSVTGHQITYYLDENRSLVDSQGSRRVRAFYEQGGSR
jgi:lipopolysaccharide export system protein LptA